MLTLPRHRDACQRRLDFFYQRPNPLHTWEEWQKYLHMDLIGLSASEIRRERAQLKYRLLFEDDPDDWFFQRFEALEKALKVMS